MGRSFKDFDKKLKPVHLNAGPNLVTVTHVGIKREPPRDKITIIGGDKDNLPAVEYEDTLILYYREIPLKAHSLNVTNRTFLSKRIGDDPTKAVGCVLTLERKDLKGGGNFGGETIVITAVKKPQTAASPAEEQAQAKARDARLAVFKSEWKKEAALLRQLGLEPIVPSAEEINALSVEGINAQIETMAASIVSLTERLTNRKQRADAETRLTSLWQEAGRLGYEPAVSVEVSDMTEEEIDRYIQEASEYINTHAGQSEQVEFA